MAAFDGVAPVVDRDTKFHVTFILDGMELAVLTDAVRNHCNPENRFDSAVLGAVQAARNAVAIALDAG